MADKRGWAHLEWGKLYDGLAQKEPSEICASSRYGVVNNRVVRRIERDVTRKLRLAPTDNLLDIGCGTGLISINLSRKVGQATGLDYGQSVLARARNNFRASGREMDFVRGDVTSLPFKEDRFSKVLCYSVVMCLQDYEDFKEALVEMTRVCQPGGLVLVGDIPEKNKKEAWIEGGRRQGEFPLHYWGRRAWEKFLQFKYKISARQFEKRKAKIDVPPSQAPGMTYDAGTILRICEEIGVKGRILDQPGSLAFGHTRVDLLIEKQAEGKG